MKTNFFTSLDSSPDVIAYMMTLHIAKEILSGAQLERFLERAEAMSTSDREKSLSVKIARLAADCMKPEQRAEFARMIDEAISQIG